MQSHWPHPPEKSDMLAQVPTPQVYEWSLLISHTLLAASKDWDIISIATAQSSGSVLDQLLPWVRAGHSLTLTKHNCQYELRSLISQEKHRHQPLGNRDAAALPQEAFAGLPRALRRTGRKDSCQAHLFPGRFIQASFGETNTLQDYTEPGLNKSKFW